MPHCKCLKLNMRWMDVSRSCVKMECKMDGPEGSNTKQHCTVTVICYNLSMNEHSRDIMSVPALARRAQHMHHELKSTPKILLLLLHSSSSSSTPTSKHNKYKTAILTTSWCLLSGAFQAFKTVSHREDSLLGDSMRAGPTGAWRPKSLRTKTRRFRFLKNSALKALSVLKALY